MKKIGVSGSLSDYQWAGCKFGGLARIVRQAPRKSENPGFCIIGYFRFHPSYKTGQNLPIP